MANEIGKTVSLQGGQFTKLTELVLKNNIQCKLYSKVKIYSLDR